MKLNNLLIDFSLFFKIARDGYEKCIQDEENEFLKCELNRSLSEIKISDKEIRILFSERNIEVYNIEVILQLLDGNNVIGKYTYVLNNENHGIDDSLVFY